MLRTAVVAVVGALALWGCSSDTSAAGDQDTQSGAQDIQVGQPDIARPDVPVAEGTMTVEPEPAAADPAFATAFGGALTEGASMSVASFIAAHTPSNAPVEHPLGYDPLASEYVQLIDEELALNDTERALLSKNGFVVSERLSYPSFGEALMDVYRKDLPILITADMILHALHASYDAILAEIEGDLLVGLIKGALLKTRSALPTESSSTLTADAIKDADLFLTVALSLLDTTQVPARDATLNDEVAKLLTAIDSGSMEATVLFGTPRVMDWSQFTPRGHYAESEILRAYFRAMIWLGRADLRFVEFDPWLQQWVFHGRQLAAGWALAHAAESSGALLALDQADAILQALVGEIDYVTVAGVLRLSKDHGLLTLEDAATIAGTERQALVDDLVGGRYGAQRINSHFLETNPNVHEPVPLPAAFTFFGQRYTVDSHVFTNVVYDRVQPVGDSMRVLPSPLDALFVLGNDLALPHLTSELETYQYQSQLHSMRFLVDWYDEAFWEGNLYSLWLHALRAMNAPTTDEMFPAPMRTPAWRDRVLNTQLASWAELRHDTILYAKQSYTGVPGCDHPDGFVEPYPALWGRLELLAERAKAALETVQGAEQAADHFERWHGHMGQLRAIAEKELAGQPLGEADIAFLQSTVVDPEEGSCGPAYSGWYPTLFYPAFEDKVAEWKPTIADVHTNPNEPPRGPHVLHVGTGYVNLMILTSDTCDGPEAFVGAALSYHELAHPKLERLTDEDWSGMLQDGAEPARPAFTSSYLAPAVP